MTDAADPTTPPRKVLTPAADPPANDDPWRTMAGLLGRAWLAREKADRSGAFAPMAHPGALAAVPLPLAPAAVRPYAPAHPAALHFRAPPGHRTPVGGVASFVVDVAAAQPPMDPDARHPRRTGGDPREHRGIHCRFGGPLDPVTHNPCQRPSLRA